jgi:predicted DNA-binding transcriptional regulator AlpA
LRLPAKSLDRPDQNQRETTMPPSKPETQIERAKAQAEQWRAQADEHKRRPSYLHLSPDELIELVEDTKRLTTPELEALDEAWFAMFGELLVLPVLWESAERPPDAPSEPEPADMDVLGWEAAAKLAGVHVSTLRREMYEGRFPRPRRISQRRIGWPASEVRAWRDALDRNRHRERDERTNRPADRRKRG